MTLTHAFVKVVWFIVVGLGPLAAVFIIAVTGVGLALEAPEEALDGNKFKPWWFASGAAIVCVLAVLCLTVMVWSTDHNLFWGDYNGVQEWRHGHQTAEKP